jgi:hypothetical protein
MPRPFESFQKQAREKTWPTRALAHYYWEELGMSEEEATDKAIKELVPEGSQAKEFKKWKKYDLWPLPKETLPIYEAWKKRNMKKLKVHKVEDPAPALSPEDLELDPKVIITKHEPGNTKAPIKDTKEIPMSTQVKVTPKIPASTPENQEALSALIDLYESGKLTELLDWYENTRHEVNMKTPQQRPLFKGKLINTGIRISEPILKKAQAKLKTERGKTGGSLSKLLELLLWKYIDSPPELIEGNE